MRTLIVALMLCGCTAPEGEAPDTAEQVPAKAGGTECDAAPAQYALGKKHSPALAKELLAKTGAGVLRLILPGTIVTMDYSPVRLNISYDDNMIIDRISCG